MQEYHGKVRAGTLVQQQGGEICFEGFLGAWTSDWVDVMNPSLEQTPDPWLRFVSRTTFSTKWALDPHLQLSMNFLL